ncbi:unnamed protein product [Somion occarium]|uniref:Uncharacterized protein n=1 Tax=Somion occarium TaxID=3059160 RepID=A0ABP1CPE4_9APHY
MRGSSCKTPWSCLHKNTGNAGRNGVGACLSDFLSTKLRPCPRLQGPVSTLRVYSLLIQLPLTSRVSKLTDGSLPSSKLPSCSLNWSLVFFVLILFASVVLLFIKLIILTIRFKGLPAAASLVILRKPTQALLSRLPSCEISRLSFIGGAGYNALLTEVVGDVVDCCRIVQSKAEAIEYTSETDANTVYHGRCKDASRSILIENNLKLKTS